MKKAKAFILAGILSLGALSIPAYALGPLPPTTVSEFGTPLTIHIDGKYISTDVQPDLIDGRTFLPMRVIAEAMDAEVFWDGSQQRVHVEKEEKDIDFYVGNTTYYINDTAKTSNVAPYLKDGRTMLPVRALSEALDASVLWDQSWADVQITTKGAESFSPKLPQDIPWQVKWLVQKYYVEPTATGCGSWYLQEDSNERLCNNEYIFISEAQNGQKNFTAIFMRDTNVPNPLDPNGEKLPELFVFTGVLEENNGEYSATLLDQVYSYNSMGGLGNRLHTYHFKMLPDNGLMLTGHTSQGFFDNNRTDLSYTFHLI